MVYRTKWSTGRVKCCHFRNSGDNHKREMMKSHVPSIYRLHVVSLHHLPKRCSVRGRLVEGTDGRTGETRPAAATARQTDRQRGRQRGRQTEDEATTNTKPWRRRRRPFGAHTAGTERRHGARPAAPLHEAVNLSLERSYFCRTAALNESLQLNEWNERQEKEERQQTMRASWRTHGRTNRRTNTRRYDDTRKRRKISEAEVSAANTLLSTSLR